MSQNRLNSLDLSPGTEFLFFFRGMQEEEWIHHIIIIRVNREIARRQHVALGTLGDGGPKTSNKHAHGEVMLRACDCAALYAGDACTNFDRLL